jgi:hypothetical protein
VVTLTPPAALPGAPPINIRNNVKNSVDSRIAPKLSVLNPAVRVVTESARRGMRTIAFTKARRITELMHQWLRQSRPASPDRSAAARLPRLRLVGPPKRRAARRPPRSRYNLYMLGIQSDSQGT